MGDDERVRNLQYAARELASMSRTLEGAGLRNEAVDVEDASGTLGELVDAFNTMTEQLRLEIGGPG